jgi:putative oxidoreductase
MKIITLIARILLGLVFLVFGLNGFLNFLHGQLPPGTAGVFLGALISSHYVYLVAGTQVIAGVFLLVNRYVPLALALLAAVIANIIVFHLTMSPERSQPAVIVAILWVILACKHRGSFAALFASRSD